MRYLCIKQPSKETSPQYGRWEYDGVEVGAVYELKRYKNTARDYYCEELKLVFTHYFVRKYFKFLPQQPNDKRSNK